MDWVKVVEINKAVLVRIIAELIALLNIQNGRVAARIPVAAYRLAARIVQPAESAVRRLIVIAARGLVVQQVPARPFPQGIVRNAKTPARSAFQLFDPRKQFEEDAKAFGGPRIRIIDVTDPRVGVALAQAARLLEPRDTASREDAGRLARRLWAVKLALDHLPRQAKRLLRWRARRAAKKAPTFTVPMRPGPPPGSRKRGDDPIDRVLRECHALAWRSLQPDSS